VAEFIKNTGESTSEGGRRQIKRAMTKKGRQLLERKHKGDTVCEVVNYKKVASFFQEKYG